MRRAGRRGARAATTQSAAAIMASLAPYSWVEADSWSVDGVTGKVSAFTDKVAAGTGIKAITPTHQWEQATDAKQVAIPVAGTHFGSRLVAALNALSIYASSSTAAAWTHAHDGTGAFECHVFASTSASSTFIAVTGTSSTIPSRITRLTTSTPGTTINNATVQVAAQSSAAISLNAATYIMSSYKTQSGNDLQVYTKGTAVGAAETATPAVGAPGSPARIFGNNAGNSGLIGEWRMSAFWNRELTAAEIVRLQRYIAIAHGVVT